MRDSEPSFPITNTESSLLRRLLKRVQSKAEHVCIDGRSLDPVALRYDIMNTSSIGIDRFCTFLCFPYLSVNQPRKIESEGLGLEGHPMRTLLQSQYRTINTTERDNDQCIRLLSGRMLNSCIDSLVGERKQRYSQSHGQLVYVSQMWAVVFGDGKSSKTRPFKSSSNLS